MAASSPIVSGTVSHSVSGRGGKASGKNLNNNKPDFASLGQQQVNLVE